MFPERFANLPAYAFPRLRALLDHHPAGGPTVHMTIGEPQHAFPAWVGDIIAAEVAGFGQYPPNDGTPELQAAIAGWLSRRYGITVNSDTQVMNVNGTREALFTRTLKPGARPIDPDPACLVSPVDGSVAGIGPRPITLGSTPATA